MEKKTRKSSSILKGINATYIIIAITIIGILLGVGLTIKITQAKDVTVPNLVGKTLEESKTLLKENNLILGDVIEQNSIEFDNGVVISQEPSSDSLNVKEGTKINIVVCSSVKSVEVPKVVGKTKSEAIKELEKLNLKVQVIEELNDMIEKGYVLKQEPQEDEILKENDIVKIYISIGSEN